jgi:putative FmdB family regulatory protein
MPIYEYQCDKCHHHLEALQKYSDKPLRECPECGKHSLKRLMSAPRFRLAGSGWYETDFKSENERKRNLVEGGDKKEGAAAEATTPSGDAKPAESAPAAKTDAPAAPSKSGDGESKRRSVVSKPAAKPKPVLKVKPRAVTKPAAGKAAVRKR